MVINDKLSDFLQAARVRHKVSPGCSMYQDPAEQSDPCHEHRCQNEGLCVANKAYGTYECTCKTPYEGKFCELRSSKLNRKNFKNSHATYLSLLSLLNSSSFNIPKLTLPNLGNFSIP